MERNEPGLPVILAIMLGMVALVAVPVWVAVVFLNKLLPALMAARAAMGR